MRRAVRLGSLVRVFRRLQKNDHFDAYVHEIGRQWVLLEPVRDRIDLDGYDILRVRDVAKVEDSPKKLFYEAVLRKRRQKPTRTTVNLDTTDSLLLSSSRTWPLIVIHREARDPDVCEVGSVIEAGSRQYVLRPIDTSGVFEPPETYRTSDVTRVQFGGGYESALALVARPSATSGSLVQAKSTSQVRRRADDEKTGRSWSRTAEAKATSRSGSAKTGRPERAARGSKNVRER